MDSRPTGKTAFLHKNRSLVGWALILIEWLACYQAGKPQYTTAVGVRNPPLLLILIFATAFDTDILIPIHLDSDAVLVCFIVNPVKKCPLMRCVPCVQNVEVLDESKWRVTLMMLGRC